MPIAMKNQSTAQQVRVLFLTNNLDEVPPEKAAVMDPTFEIEIIWIRLAYTVATDAGTIGGTIQVGIPSDPDLYAGITPAASTAIGTVTTITPLSTARVPAGTPLQILNTYLTGDKTSIGEVVAFVGYRLHG